MISRKTVLAFILLILGSVLLSYAIPQRLTSPAQLLKWQQSHPAWFVWIKKLALDHIFTSPWFALILFLFSISLALSSVDQCLLALQKTFRTQNVPNGGGLDITGRESLAESMIRLHGYLPVAAAADGKRFVKHPWGYWGNFFLHAGILIAIISSITILVTQKRGLVYLTAGETLETTPVWRVEERGLLATPMVLPARIRLDSFVPEFWETDDVKQLKSSITFLAADGTETRKTLAINDTFLLNGVKVYQSSNFGHAFYLEFTGPEQGKYDYQLQIESPSHKDKAAYGNFDLPGIPFQLKAKYYADAEKRGMDGNNPLLVLRLVSEGRVLGEVSLKTGESGQLGPYKVRLVHVGRWTGMIFVRTMGMGGIFLGFFLVILGGFLYYFTPPREFFLVKRDGRVCLQWTATRFREFYDDEFTLVAEGCKLHNLQTTEAGHRCSKQSNGE